MLPTTRTAVLATTATTVALVELGRRHAHTPWAPLDAVSHIAWGDRAFGYDRLDVSHTLVGAVLNAGAMWMWSAIAHGVIRRPTIVRALVGGAVVSAAAYVVDYHVVPKRFTPGFEYTLPRRGLTTVYVVLAAALACGLLLERSWTSSPGSS